jgi:hypothetical protein
MLTKLWRFLRTPKGLVTIVLLALVAIAIPVEGARRSGLACWLHRWRQWIDAPILVPQWRLGIPGGALSPV